MLVVVCNWFPKLDFMGNETTEKEFVADYAVDSETDNIVPIPNDHPESLGATFDYTIGEWVIERSIA